ncbi:amidohydrolase [Natronorubrum texcoconense]|uniref:5-methylthioadenosine/S-adenosylhomocysteine deaminase n=1 Tax=Natronorubrum texcoconense TaxID=1095776 RepID=A0A1G9B7F5_9EURY|nr:amidohydrolase [Natronorubrum texcoconense]SDK34970.1 5-methylthioadenosine/S-adenosylhomocysteine deaminase [Natronorubrum texcoconense]
MTTLAITGGQVLLPDITVTRADVLVDQDGGEILEVGDDLASDADETLDATDSLVTPGFVNGHCHVAMTLMRGYADDKSLDAWLQEDIWPTEAELTPDDVYHGTRLGALEMIKSGTTAFADMYFMVPNIADAVEEAGLRARLGHGIVTVASNDEEAREDAREGLEVAEELDGRADGRISTAFMPHSLTTIGSEYLEEFVPQARDLGVPIHYHANETTNEVTPIVEEHGVRPMAYAAERGMVQEGDFVAHGVHLDESEIGLLAEAGTSVVHCPASNMKLASGMAPVQRMLDAGVTVGIGTDGAASNNDLSMLDEARDAAMIGKLETGDASAVPAESVVEMMTQGSADAIGLDVGRLEEGAPADLAVLDLESAHLTPRHDLVSHLAYAAAASDVRHTVCDGQVLMCDRDVRSLDEEAVRTQASEAAEALVDRAEN